MNQTLNVILAATVAATLASHEARADETWQITPLPVVYHNKAKIQPTIQRVSATKSNTPFVANGTDWLHLPKPELQGSQQPLVANVSFAVASSKTVQAEFGPTDTAPPTDVTVVDEPAIEIQPDPLPLGFDSVTLPDGTSPTYYVPGQGFSTVGCGEGCGFTQQRNTYGLCCGQTFYAGFMFLSRSDSEGGLLVQDPTNAGRGVRGDSFDFGVQGGFEIGMTAHEVADRTDLDFRFFRVGRWTDSRSDFLGSSRIATQPPINVAGARRVLSDYSTSLASFEVNFRERQAFGVQWLTTVAGFRYLNLDESLHGTLIDPLRVADSQQLTVDVDNRLYGAQIGVDAAFYQTCRFRLEGFGRVGLYGNAGETGVNQVTFGATTVSSSLASSQTGRLSFVGEVGLRGTYRINDRLNLYGRYQVLAVDGINSADEQLLATNLATGSVPTTQGAAIYQGGTLGVELKY